MTELRRFQPDPRDDAEQLTALIQEAREAGIQRRALLVRLSELPQQVVLPHHRRLAREAVEPIAMADRARVFLLPNNDLVVIWRGPGGVALDQSLAAIRLLFEDDAALLPSPDTLCLVLDLPEQADRLLRIVETSMLSAPLAGPRPSSPAAPLDLATLAAVENALASADVARLVRRRAVCSRAEGGGLRLRWESRTLSIDELTETVAPGVDVTADPWLFRRLTRVLDRRMLALLAAPDELRGAGPFGLGLNVASILSPEFLRFDAGLPAALRGQIVLGVNCVDMLADPAAFVFARDFTRARQYRLLLRSASPLQAELVPLARCELELVELPVSPALLGLDLAAAGIEAKRCLVTGVDSAEAMAWVAREQPGFVSGRLIVPDEWRRAGG